MMLVKWPVAFALMFMEQTPAMCEVTKEKIAFSAYRSGNTFRLQGVSYIFNISK